MLVLMISWLIAMTLEHYAGHHRWSMLGSSLAKREQMYLASKQRNSSGLKISDEFSNIFTFVQVGYLLFSSLWFSLNLQLYVY